MHKLLVPFVCVAAWLAPPVARGSGPYEVAAVYSRSGGAETTVPLMDGVLIPDVGDGWLLKKVQVTFFFKFHRGHKFASWALMVPITEAFIKRVEQFVGRQNVPLITFEKNQRKDDVMKEHLAKFKAEEGVLFVGKAQEKTPVIRTERRRDAKTGQPYPWLVKSTAKLDPFTSRLVPQGN